MSQTVSDPAARESMLTELDRVSVSSFSNFSSEAYTKIFDEATCEVHIKSRITLEDYERITPASDMARLKEYAKSMQGKKLMFLNATYAGGGVAIMRSPLIHLLRTVGVDAHWYVLKPDEAAFKVTKWKFHNVLQAVADPGGRLNEENKKKYKNLSEKKNKDLTTTHTH